MIKSSNDQLLESVFVKIFMDIVRIFKENTFNCLDMRHFNPAKRTGWYCCISCSSNQRRAFSGHTTTYTATPRMLCGDTIKYLYQLSENRTYDSIFCWISLKRLVVSLSHWNWRKIKKILLQTNSKLLFEKSGDTTR